MTTAAMATMVEMGMVTATDAVMTVAAMPTMAAVVVAMTTATAAVGAMTKAMARALVKAVRAVALASVIAPAEWG